MVSQFTIDLAIELLKQGHFVIIVSNGCAQDTSYKQLAEIDPKLRSRLLIKFSFHYLELQRLNLFATYWKHVDLIKKSGAAYCLEFCPSDEAIPYKEDIKKICIEHVGALPHVTIPRDNTSPDAKILTNLTFEEFRKCWGEFDSEMFDIKEKSYAIARKEFCYAGKWSIYLNAGTGRTVSCHFGDVLSEDIFKNITKPIPFKCVGKCRAPYCINAHCGMCMGCLPKVKSQTFCVTRDRVCTDGTHWLTDEWIEFSSQKLYDNNKKYPRFIERRIQSKSSKNHHHSFWWHLRHMKF